MLSKDPPAPVSASPSRLGVARISGARFDAGRPELEQICQQILGSGTEWTLLTDYIFVEWGVISEPVVDQAEAPEIDTRFLCVRALVSRELPDGLRDVRSLVTHAFVDNAWVMMRGREAFGVPVLLATFTDYPQGLLLDLVVDAGAPRQTVLSLEWTEGTSGDTEGYSLAWLKDQLKIRSEEQGEKGEEKGEEQEPETLPFLLLKQMRDGMQPDRACYQELVEASISFDFHVESVRRFDATLTLPQVWPLKSPNWGLPARAQSVIAYQVSAVTLGLQAKIPAARVVLSGRHGPRLRQRRGDAQAAPEYAFTDVELTGFKIPVSYQKLKAVCDEFLNHEADPDRGYSYVPANVDLIIECLHYPSMTSENPPFDIEASVKNSQRELVFRMLVGRVDSSGRRMHLPAVFCPFVFVDSPFSLISGREVIGYPKLFASFESFGDTGQFEACKVTAAPEGMLERQPLITFDCRFEREPRSPDALFTEKRAKFKPDPRQFQPAELIDFSWWGLPDLQSSGEPDESFVTPWLEGVAAGYPGLQVKCFPDAYQRDKECYREFVEADYALLKVAATLPRYDASLHFPSADHHGIAKAFGLPPIVPVPRGSWYRTKIDFRFRVTDPLA